jgi:NAD(P)-dependent dehydrogenase (short-subunit alcohol dehydrogenase family)
VKRGYNVVLACRSEKAGKEAVKGMQNAAGQGAAHFIGTMDLASPESITAFANTFRARFSRLDLLVNNAACNFVPEYHTPAGVLGIVQVCSTMISLQF